MIAAGIFAFASDVILFIQLNDARDAADTQHMDTMSAIRIAREANKATSEAAAAQVKEMAKQSIAMQGQLSEMQVQSAIQRAQIKSVLQLTIERAIIPPDSMNITIIWTNTGKSEAINVRGWRDIAAIPRTHNHQKDEEIVRNFDFLNPPPGMEMPSEGGNLIAGDGHVLGTQTISNAKALAAANADIGLVSYGYIEYFDIFGTFYTVRFCRQLLFEKTEDGIIHLGLPVKLPLPCEKQTEKPRDK